jgi:8-amino-7-oxononanoate synthase
VFPHLDVAAAERALSEGGEFARRWVITESYFSMDGDSPDLLRLRAVCDTYDAGLVVDEAHALGVFGPEGRGLCAAAGIAPDVLIGTAGKALGLQGAFAVGSATLRLWLWNRARTFVFSTGVSPALAAALRARVLRARADEASRQMLRRRTEELRAALVEAGVPGVAELRGPILPWIVGGAERALDISRRLWTLGIAVQPIRPPTVPVGASRLRVTANARLSDESLDQVRSALCQVGRTCRLA